MAKSREYGDVIHMGEHKFIEIPIVPASSFGNTEIDGTDPLDAEKSEQQYIIGYAAESGTANADEARVLHVATAAGTIVGFRAGNVVPAVGAAKNEIDLLVNGASVLTAVVEVNVAHAAYEVVAAVVTTAAYVADDVLEVKFNETAGGGTAGKGAFCSLVLREGAE